MLIKSAIANRACGLCCTMALVFSISCPREKTSKPASVMPQGGVALGLFASDPDYNYDKLLREVRLHQGQRLLIVVPLYLDTVISHEIHLVPGRSPSVSNIERTLGQARRYGFEISLMPILRLQHRDNRDWRGVLEPRAGRDVFFHHYENATLPLAALGAKYKIKRFVVGSELLSLENEREAWSRLITKIRKKFNGIVSYAANWDHYRGPSFWDLVDEMGVSSYFELNLREGPNSERIGHAQKQWQRFIQEAAGFSQALNKPLMLMEVGYPSQVTAAQFPWDETRHSAIDLQLQSDLYAAFCGAIAMEKELVFGFFFWNWFGFGGEKDDSYTPRGKPAAHMMKDCLKRF